MTKLNRQIEMLQTTLEMLKATTNSAMTTDDLHDVDSDSRHIKQLADSIHNTIQQALEKVRFEY